jgi:hypothetical protein
MRNERLGAVELQQVILFYPSSQQVLDAKEVGLFDLGASAELGCGVYVCVDAGR